MLESFFIVLGILVLVALVAVFLTRWWLTANGTVAKDVAPPAERRCRTITFTYSNGEAQTFHSCKGHTDFTDRCGRRLAPKGTTLVSAKGGAHARQP